MKLCVLLLLLAMVLMEGVVEGKTVNLRRRRHRMDEWREHHLKKGHPLDKKLPVLPKARATGPSTVPLKGGEIQIGEVYMDIALGTPLKGYTAQVDTGSSDFAIPDSRCGRKCGHPPAVYESSASSSSEKVECSSSGELVCVACSQNGQCEYSIRYADNSGYSAEVFTDEMRIEGFPNVKQSFGGIYRESNPGGGDFEPAEVDGIVGFAYQQLSEINAPTPIDNLVQQAGVADVFSMCLTDIGGQMTLGGVGNHYMGSMQYTNITEELWYVVNITDMTVGHQSLGILPAVFNDGGSIVDSGTTLFYIPTPAFNQVKKIMESNCTAVPLVGICNVGRENLFNGYCFAMTAQDIAMFPPLTISFLGGVKIVVPPQYYLVPGFCGDNNLYSLGFDDGGIGDGTIMGDVVMRNYEVVFDRANKRIGFGLMSGC